MSHFFAQSAPKGRWLPQSALALCCLVLATVADPAWPQQSECPQPPALAVNTSPGGGCNDFFDCFAYNGNISSYGVQLPANNGASTYKGDLNSTYFDLYYSIANANALNGGTSCYELVIVGTFPNARYFSVTSNDMHYSNAQHLADFTIDPADTHYDPSWVNPFAPGETYIAGQWYLIPVSLGAIPATGSPTSRVCSINPYEGDNLLDATQRHYSMDWNTLVQGSESAAPPSTAHVVDNPAHTAGNTAGDVLIRNYLPLSPDDVPAPYVILRDVATGCAYYNPATYSGNSGLFYTGAKEDCTGSSPDPSCEAIVSTVDLSCPPGSPQCSNPSTSWLDTSQQALHTKYTEVTPQACYASGSSANEVAWVRGPEWVGRPGPDDSYLGAVISATDLQNAAGSAKAIMMQFQLPNMPDTPCASGCSLSGNEQLRYLSFSFVQPQSTGAEPLAMNPDGIDPLASSSGSTIISLADSAFCTNSDCTTPACAGSTPCYVTLIVGVGPSVSGVSGTTTCWTAGVASGYVPPSPACAVEQGRGYTVLDLSQFTTAAGCTGACFSTSQNLQIVMRETLPNAQSTAQPAPFNCSGQEVPFSTAEYTNADLLGAGLMGPYVPLVRPRVISGSTGLPVHAPTPALPSASQCGVLPSAPPLLTPNTALSLPSNVVQWPTFWPQTPASAQSLYCGLGSQPTSPTISFAASLLGTEDWPTCTSPGLICNYVYALPDQTDAFTTPTLPPLPVDIVGSGFGYLPEVLPYAVQSSPYIEIADNGVGNGGSAWDTGAGGTGGASCQIYIANWTDTSISVLANLPIDAFNQYLVGTYLSPISDASPLTFFPNHATPTPYNVQNCPLSNGDTLTFLVTNPQSGITSSSFPVCVGSPGIAACP